MQWAIPREGLNKEPDIFNEILDKKQKHSVNTKGKIKILFDNLASLFSWLN